MNSISLQHRHSFRLNAYAREFISIREYQDLAKVKWQRPIFVLGDGSNTIFVEDYEGVVLHNELSDYSVDETSESWMINAGAGKNWHRLVHDTVVSGIAGLENLALIPGSVGAAPVQNIGAYGVELSKFLKSVDVYDFKHHEQFKLSNEECKFGYRDSIFKASGNEHLMITAVTLELPKHWQPELSYPDLQSLNSDSSAQEVMHHVIGVRSQKLPDPQVIPNAGSFFKNPVITREQFKLLQSQFPDVRHFPMPEGQVKIAAAWLIDQAGLKSAKFGGAGVNPRQALVLVNENNATGQNILDLARHIIEQVERKFSIQLQPEVRLMGAKGTLDIG